MPSTPAPAPEATFSTTPLSLAKPAVPAKPSPGLSPRAGILAAHWPALTGALFILIVGFALRLVPFFGVPDRLTVDEHLYITNVMMLKAVGPFEYGALVQNYVRAQSQMEMVMLPPTRCVYIMLGWAWDAAFHSGPQMSLRYVSAIFSCLSLLLSGVFAFRLGGARVALVVTALMAVAPLELVMAHRELVDGVFAFWALLCLWLLWENLQRPGRLGWLAAYAGAIAVMVLTKENAFFATVALGGIISTAWLFPALNLGKVRWSTVFATAAGPVLGVTVLVCIAGSPHTLIETYRLLVTKAEKMSFAYQSGGGPWFRYIVDIMLVSPTVLIPAIGGIFALRRENRQGILLLLFMVFSCAIMVNVKNGMNLRYSTMWDMPLRYLAAGPILQIAGAMRRWQLVTAVLLLVIVGGVELHQYCLIFVQHDTGDPITQFLMFALEIIRPPLR
jgi:4-amino-4-deoxy-L-arabinose transferase-like glycosyltransferase